MTIKFSSSKEAREFLEDKTRWQEWFKWMVLEEHKDLSYERLAWLNIYGVPLRYWDGDNFSRIATRFGKVIIPFDNIHDRRDLSMGKVGVNTTRKTWINEEVQIGVDGAVYVVGVIEYSEEWSPFNPCHSDKVAKEFDSDVGVDDDDVEEGISDTWLHENDNELEEREFRSDSTPKNQPEKIRCQDENGESPGNPVNEVETTVDSTMRISQGVELVNTDNLCVSIGSPQEVNTNTVIMDTECKVTKDLGNTGMKPTDNVVGPSINNELFDSAGPILNSSPPAQNIFTTQNCTSSSCSSRCSSERKFKRRKRAKGCRSPPTADPTPVNNSSSQYGVYPRLHNTSVSLDLNRDPPISVSTHNSTDGQDKTVPNEIRQTVVMGLKLAFKLSLTIKS